MARSDRDDPQPSRSSPRHSQRYSAYTGGPDPLAPPVDLREALEQIGQDVMAGTTTYYPPAAFYFRVTVTSIDGANEGNFQEVSGLNVRLDVEEVKEGGENRFAHRLPARPKYENLVLKRGMVTSSKLITWARQATEQFTFTTQTVVVSLMDENGADLAVWNIVNAWPVGLKMSEFKAQDNAIAVETLELSFDYFERIK